MAAPMPAMRLDGYPSQQEAQRRRGNNAGPGDAITCFLCNNVAEDNTCVHSENTCDSGLWQFCFTRLISKGKVMINVDRGCSSVCRILKKEKEDFEENMVCCVRDLCNYHNFWSNQ